MVGYILGIGDRHVQNILVDLNTAEVIHIDFGIAFEQGKILPHPELIPFRLTRDLVAPMGVCGVDGVFRKTCEKTMEILRQNEKTLTTILEVLLYDPMYAWTISSKQAQRRQLESDDDDSDDGTNQVERDSMASRALLKIQGKLKGQTDDSTGYSSVEGQVECLIQKAISPALLSRLFRGWQSYL
jgi:serine-protein kinase ATM